MSKNKNSKGLLDGLPKLDYKGKKPKFDRVKQDLLVKLITDGGTFQSACQDVGISRTTEWKLRQKDKDYKNRVETAKNIRTQSVESKLYEQCMDGNTTAIIFYLKTHRPNKYNIKQIRKIEQKLKPYQVKEIRMI